MNLKSSSQMPTTPDWSAGHKLLGEYEVIRVLGEGGMGKVYLVRSLSTGSQFAVKRAKGMHDADRKNFLAELQTWIDLPEHPNLVPCRFFRTVDAEVLIFAEYVEGGSLRDWIDSRRLYEGGPSVALERMLDVAIQFAWGLHCVHELGTVHQDVKPGNVLMGTDGNTGVQGVRPQVTDYGLARARAAAGETIITDPCHSILVSSGGGTPAYWSPEQAEGLPLTHKTDIWSWGVSVLELFTGEVTWMSGLGAGQVLELYLQEDEYDDATPPMPDDMVDLLRKCFLQDPQERPESLADAVEKLQVIYRDSIGVGYSRKLDLIERDVLPRTGIKERRHTTGTDWTDPQVWLERALLAAGRDPGEAAAILTRRGATRRGELVAELIAYDEAKRLYEELIVGGIQDLEGDLATLCIDKALVHGTAADKHGAIKEYDQAIAIRERLVNQEGHRELANNLAMAYHNKASSLNDLGDHSGAVVIFDQAIVILEQLVKREGRHDLVDDLASTYMNKAIAVSDLGDFRAAAALYDQAIVIQEHLVNQEDRRDVASHLATTYLNKAQASCALGDTCGAVSLCDHAIPILERLVCQDGRSELSNTLAGAYANKATLVSFLGDKHLALILHDQAITIGERLVNQEGRQELANDLAVKYRNKAIAVRALGDDSEALVLYNDAIAIWERLVNHEGRRELADELASTYHYKAILANDLGFYKGAIDIYSKAIAIWELLVHQEGRHALVDDLASAYMNKAISVKELGDNCAALVLYDQAIGLREWLVKEGGRPELADDLALVYLNKAVVVSSLGDNGGAIELFDQAIAIREWLVNQEGGIDLVGDLAWVKSYRGFALIELGEMEKGLQEMRSAQSILEVEVARTGRTDLEGILARLQQQLSKYST
jgi:serine/threonine protein kinase